jgi:hypothetical protein
MGHSDRRAVGEAVAVVAVDVVADGPVARDVDVDRAVTRQLGDVSKVFVEVNRIVDV